MKKLIVICVVAIMSMTLAQTASAGRFGIKGGVNLTSMDFKSGVPATLGYQAGITWQWNLPLGFAIQPDLLYHVKASRFDEINEETFGLGYIELPINLQWGLRFVDRNVRIFAQASPFIGYAVSQIGEIMQGEGDKWYGVNRFSYGAGLGVGVQLWALQVTAQYNWNLGSLANVENFTFGQLNDANFGGATISIALMFGGKKKNKQE